MEIIKTESPSFPDAEFDKLLSVIDNERWQVICGDSGHWRCGIYSPEFQSEGEIVKLEKHDCPELFLLIDGEMSLLIAEDENKKIVVLEKMKPILVSGWHSGFCPNGKFTGKAFVIERDQFITEYMTLKELNI